MTQSFETLAIHAGQDPESVTGAVVPPIFATTTYQQDAVGAARHGYEYSRTANPTRRALEQCLAALEGGQVGLAFASGLAAEDTLLRTVCAPGDHVVIPDDAYGGTYRLFARVAERWGLRWTAVPLHDLEAAAAALARETRLLWIETPTNPLLRIADIAALAALAHDAHARVVVDNTFASPYLQQPLTLGADVVVHSTTKYCGGHSDVLGGALIVSDPGLGEELAVRMERHCDNAERVAEFLTTRPELSEVLYPGLPGHPGHAVAASQMRRFGGMVSFRVRAGETAAVEICNRTRLFLLAESLGGVESLIEHPGRMTHASAAGSPLEVPGDLVRLSVGIEAVDDLIADLAGALASVR